MPRPDFPQTRAQLIFLGLKVFRYHENWLDFWETEQNLKGELYLFQAGLGGYRHASDKQALFVEHVERRIRKEVQSWEARTQPEEHRDVQTTKSGNIE